MQERALASHQSRTWPWRRAAAASRYWVLAGVAAIGTLNLPLGSVGAQPAPEPLELHAEEAPELPDVIDLDASATTLTLSAGATLNTGNTRSFLGNVGMRFNLLRGRHNFLAMGQGIYGQASLRDANNEFLDRETNARTVTARARYDFSVTLSDAVYAGVNTRHDIFAGMDVRVQNQVGYKRLLWGDKAKHFVSSEVGYDFTYDKLVDGGGDDLVHSVRLFAEYMNRLSEHASFFTGFELLLDVEESENVRFEWVTELQTTIYNQLKLGVNFAARFDNRPLDVAPGVPADKLDTITTLNLVYDFDFERDARAKAAKASAAEAEAERRDACEKPCECPDAAEVCADWDGVTEDAAEAPLLGEAPRDNKADNKADDEVDNEAGENAVRGPSEAPPTAGAAPAGVVAAEQPVGSEADEAEVDEAPLPEAAGE